MENLKPSELRIGNYVLTNNSLYRKADLGKIACIVAINSEVKVDNKQGVVTIYQIEDKYKDTYGQFLDYLKPIPISEEKLIELGFTKTEDNDYLKVGRKAFLVSLADYGDTDFHVLYRCDIGMDFCSLAYVDYIHQIQNIVFDLTGEELVIN